MVEQSSKTDSIFWSALGIAAPEERNRYLDEACADDPNLRTQLDELLAAYPKVERFLEQPAIAADATVLHAPPIAERPGTVIGPYKLLQQIGEGGMGVVFMAEQTEPLQRTVALKIIKPGMDTRQVIARFEAERQALALMDHPNIAKVLDAGTTDTGRPYFVMDLVKGVPITKYCDEKQLSLRERLELFIEVCQAVQHAHQKGIIHRDIKPTNVIVAEYDNHAVPKVIDFGVAKATAQKLTERTMFTEFGQVIGTVEYMSPEQAKLNQLDIDTRSDVYSLGVLLYELLTGSTPFEQKRLREAAFDEVLRIIREEEPPKPSTKLSSSDTLPSIAANRHTEPARLGKDIRGELDWIVMKCLEKDRNRRFETANGLARDIERYLHDEPVQACPPSASYRFRKFARRNKAALLLVSAGITTLLLLVAGLAISNWLIANERNEKAKALVEKEKALALAKTESERAEKNFLRATIAIREVLMKAATGQSEWSALPSPLRKRFSEEAAKFYETLLQEEIPDPNRRYEAAVGHRAIGTLRTTAGEPKQAEVSFRRSVAILDRLVTEHSAVPQYQHQLGWSLFNLGRTLRNTGRSEEAKPALQRAAELYEALLAQTPVSFDYRNELATCYRELTLVHEATRDFKAAEQTIHRAIAMLEAAVDREGDVPQYKEQLAGMQFSLGEIRVTTGQVEEAKAAFRAAASRYEDAFSKRQNAGILYHWAWCYQWLMELPNNDPKLAMAEAEQAYQKILDIQSRIPEDLKDHRELRERFGHIYRIRAFMLRSADRPQEAAQIFREAASIFDKLTSDEPNVAIYRDFAADTHRQIADLTRLLEEIANYSKAIKADPKQASAWTSRGLVHMQLNQLDKALADHAKAIELDPKQALYRNNRSVTYLKLNKPDDALADCAKAIELDPKFAPSWFNRGEAYRLLSQPEKAADAYLTALRLKTLPKPDIPLAHRNLAAALESMEKNQPDNDRLRRFRTEAKELLGMEGKKD